MKDKHLVILSQYFPPEMGAPQSRLYETAKGLKQKGWEVTVLTALPNYPTGRIFSNYRGRLSMREKINGIPVRRYWIYASNSKRPFPRILNMLSFSLTSFWAVFFLWRFRPTWLIAESPPLLTGLSGWVLSRLAGARFVLNVSDIWPLSAAELGAIRKGSVLYGVLEGLEGFLYRRAYACMGQSQEITDHLCRRGAKRTLLFRNGVSTSRFPVPSDKRYQKPLKIIYAGLLGVAQGMLSLCKELEFDPDQFELHLYGDGAERKSIEEYLNKNPTKGIVLHDPVKREEIPHLLVQYDLTLIPLVKPIYGAVPSKLYEAMAAGLPVLFAGGGEGAKIVEKYQVGWTCPPGDFDIMKNILASVAQLSESELLEYRQNCLQSAKEVFDRNIQLEKLHEWLTAQ